VSGDVVDRVRRRLAASAGTAQTSGAQTSEEQIRAAWRAEAPTAGPEGLAQVRRELLGVGPLEVLLADPAVDDVLVNGPDDVWICRSGRLERTGVCFPGGEDEVRRLAVRLVAAVGRRLDAAAPFADATLPDGSRLHAIIPPLTGNGTCLSLRVLRRRRFDLAGLRVAGVHSEAVAAVLSALVRAQLTVLITGGTGTGKTTLLGALLSLIGPTERLILVEDVAELDAVHPHVVRLQSRPANVEGAGEVTVRDLVRQALRMRPDRLVVGEVRGAEVVDLFTALNTGHEGSLTSLHANSAGQVPARIEALGALAGLSRAAAYSQLVAAVDVIVQLRRSADGVRSVDRIALLEASPDGVARPVDAVVVGSASGPGGPAMELIRTGPEVIAAGPAAGALAALLGRRLGSCPELLAGVAR
jgi:pilus assembly protein CpaF